jgi:hypothetical protein
MSCLRALEFKWPMIGHRCSRDYASLTLSKIKTKYRNIIMDDIESGHDCLRRRGPRYNGSSP